MKDPGCFDLCRVDYTTLCFRDYELAVSGNPTKKPMEINHDFMSFMGWGSFFSLVAYLNYLNQKALILFCYRSQWNHFGPT